MEHIRISRLKAPFVYRTMAEIELMRAKITETELPHRHDHFTIILDAAQEQGVEELVVPVPEAIEETVSAGAEETDAKKEKKAKVKKTTKKKE